MVAVNSVTRAPDIKVESLPEVEKPFARAVWFQINNLERALGCFEQDLRLYDFCAAHEGAAAMKAFQKAVVAASDGLGDRQQDDNLETLPFQWPLQPGATLFIACRDATIALWNFMQAAQALKSNLDGAPTLRAEVEIKTIDNALGQFHRKFPKVKNLMDSVRHQAELSKTPTLIEQNHRSDGDIWTDNIAGRTFMTTAFGGEMVSFEISSVSLTALKNIATSIFGAFPK